MGERAYNAIVRTVVLDDEIAALLEQEQPLERAAREAIVMELFHRGRISTGKVCELLGLERVAFVRRAAELGTPVDLTTEAEWGHDLTSLQAWRKQQS